MHCEICDCSHGSIWDQEYALAVHYVKENIDSNHFDCCFSDSVNV